MNIKLVWLTIFIIGLLFPELAYADGASDYFVDLTVGEGDKSQQFLGDLFGPVGSVLPGAGNNLLASMFKVFNNTVLSLGGVVLFYTTIMSTINTAQEGELLGRKYSAALLPLKSAASVGLLLPVGNGYSLIQVMVMGFVLKGVAAANLVWDTALDFVDAGGSINRLPAADFRADGVNSLNPAEKQFAENLFKVSVCMQYHQTHKNLTMDCRPDPFDTSKINCGVLNDFSRRNLCGEIISTKSQVAGVSVAQLRSVQRSAALISKQMLDGYGYLAIEKKPDNPRQYVYQDTFLKRQFWPSSEVLTPVVDTYKSSTTGVRREATELSDQTLRDASAIGWIFAGSYYYKLAKVNQELTSVSVAPPTIQTHTLGDTNADALVINEATRKFLEHTSGTTGRGAEMLPPVSSGATGIIGNILNTIGFGAVTQSISDSIINTLQTDGDPIVAAQKLGFTFMLTAELTFMLTFITLIALGIPLFIMSGQSPAYSVFINIFFTFLPAMAIFMMMLWTAGASLALYLPLKPYLIYMFAAVGWFVAVIEAMVASPIVALGLATPSNENLGRAAPAVVLLANVFLRPSLMVIGFIAGSRLLIVATRLMNYGFKPTIEAQVYAQSSEGIGIFAPFIIVIIYVAFLVSVVDMCFSLIYALPDRIMRWIGGQAEQSTAAQQERQTKQSFDQGAQQTQAIATQVAGAAIKLGKEAKDKADKKSEEEGKDKKDGKEGGDSGGGTGGTGGGGSGGGSGGTGGAG